MPVFAAVGAVAGVASGVLGAIGGNQQRQAQQDNADDAAKQAKKMHEWEWKETKNRESYTQYEIDLARLNEENLRSLTDTMALDKYNRELFIQDVNYKSQVDAYNASEAQYAEQLDYNKMGAQLAKDEQRLWLEEQSKLLQFQYEDIALQQAKSRDGFDIQREVLTLEHRDKRAEASRKSLEGWLKGLDASGKARVMGQSGRTRKKNLQSIAMSTGMQQAFLNDLTSKSDRAFKVQARQNRIQYEESRRQARLDKRKTASSWESALKSNQQKLLRIEYDQYGADLAADNRRMSRPQDYRDIPTIPAPYASPQTNFADAYRSKKPPGPTGAPNLMAGSGLQMFGQIAGSIGKAAAAYDPKPTPYNPPGGNPGGVYNPGQTYPNIGAGTMSGLT